MMLQIPYYVRKDLCTNIMIKRRLNFFSPFFTICGNLFFPCPTISCAKKKKKPYIFRSLQRKQQKLLHHDCITGILLLYQNFPDIYSCTVFAGWTGKLAKSQCITGTDCTITKGCNIMHDLHSCKQFSEMLHSQ